LTPLAYIGKEGKHQYWLMQCDCGNIFKLPSNTFLSKKTKSCGCLIDAVAKTRRRSEDDYTKEVVSLRPSLSVISLEDTRSDTTNTFKCSTCQCTFATSLSQIINGNISCKCSKHYYNYTRVEREGTIQDICKTKGYTFEGWLSEDYSNKSYLTLSCNKHKHTWDIQLNNLLRGHGCKHCGKEQSDEYRDNKTVQFIAMFREAHNDIYDYSKFKYQTSRDHKSTVICKEHGEFLITPDNHARGKGCSKCAKYGFDGSVPNYFYLQKLDDNYIKFGITKHPPEERMNKQSSSSIFTHELILTKLFSNGEDALALEDKVKSLGIHNVVNKEYMTDGFTETIKIEELDKIYEVIKDFTGELDGKTQ
jgi:hypothetical protein